MRYLVTLIFLCVSATALAQGKQLHDANCMQCHASLADGQPNSIYSRSNRGVKTLDGLEKRVANCAIAADVNWTPAQQKQVVEYLNSQFYKF
ncbi:MAG: hypothetical protein CMH21_03250 [Methylophaga sp.]|jgi:mono/diheme cytochrome c family protein|uniref:c-type cytochrome n=1 Tax=unclassified Methylophaga TaxID=2629249 RepID=UPI000C92B0F2|nr:MULTISPECIES: c-type cytochrome [unclassified Methylophaga]MAK67959.1 hypothetical protein [Methylophaga sp.]MAY16734.1 hypothetical protein [Methylophaga sp.]HAO23874.1 hypothetical protein [Methylophaga sp.]HCD05946.1 hypothetical protein [Methylophaga sp.]|tara:strand:+ start:1109 stop:1384 length:276 start_codon:yes stop_codon:yes gene_type:complete